MSSLHISISAETIGHIGPLAISNSIFTSIIVSALIIIFAILVRLVLKQSGKPSKLQIIAEMIVGAILGLCEDITGSATRARVFAPIILSFFLFIIVNNWFGLLPGVGTIGFYEATTHTAIPSDSLIASTEIAQETEEHTASDVPTEEVEYREETAVVDHAEAEKVFVPYFRAGTADLNTTLALALISVVLTQFFGIQYLGLSYFSKYINFKNPILTFVGLLEIVLEFAKIMSFAFRLFGNIFAGEVLLAVMMFLVPLVVPMPFYGLELFVGFIQALVFSMLSLVFFNLATVGHGEEH